MTADQVDVGQRMIVVNKFGDEISDARVSEIERDGITLDDGLAIPFRRVESYDGLTVKVTVSC